VPGWIVSVGDGTVAQVGPAVLRGGAARAMKATVGAGHLSSVGAVQQAADLVETELGPRKLDAERIDAVEEVLDDVDAPERIVDGVGEGNEEASEHESTVEPSEPVEIEIPIDDAEAVAEERDRAAGEGDTGGAADEGDTGTGDESDTDGAT
jgi:NADH dehydrogenase